MTPWLVATGQRDADTRTELIGCGLDVGGEEREEAEVAPGLPGVLAVLDFSFLGQRCFQNFSP